MSGRLRFGGASGTHDPSSDPLSNDGRDGVSDCFAAGSVKFLGNPITHSSNQIGGLYPKAAAFRITSCEYRARPVFERPHPRCPIDLVGVGNNENSLSLARGAELRKWKHSPLRIKPERGKVSKYSTHWFVSKETWNVLNEYVSGSNLPNDTSVVRPQPASFAVDSCLLSSTAKILAREAACDEVDPLQSISADCGNVSVSRNIRPMPLK
jgi:hypothetical protein